MANAASEQTKTDAMKIAKGIQKPGQTKEQTKLISQGIEKGIALYKQQQKAKSRDADKLRKQELKAKQKAKATTVDESSDDVKDTMKGSAITRYLPWFLLVTSWTGFITFHMVTNVSLTSF